MRHWRVGLACAVLIVGAALPAFCQPPPLSFAPSCHPEPPASARASEGPRLASLAETAARSFASLRMTNVEPVTTGEPREDLRLRVTNTTGGLIEASRDGGGTWITLGCVTHPALSVSRNSYTAAGWAQDSAIAATAVNALHIKLGTNPETKRPMTISVVPGGKTLGAATRAPGSTIYTNLDGGSAIFGGGLGPYVNSPVFLANSQPAVKLAPTYVPADGDVLLIIRYAPARLPRYAMIENRAGGAVEVDYGEGPVKVGVVDQPVRGIGRFEGEVLAAAGRVRANHPGVIDISTSPMYLMGGFQIIPRGHALSPELAYVKGAAQWLVIGPASPSDPDWAGQPPFFSSTILPSYRRDDLTGGHRDFAQRILSRTSVEARFGDGPWEPMPRIAFVRRQCPGRSAPLSATGFDRERESDRGRRGLWQIPGELNVNRPQPKETTAIADHALEGVTAFRLVFPMLSFWPTEGE
jgi:hypothetical protein